LTVIDAFEWASCLFGLAGALLLACNTSFSRFGWIAFLLANVTTIVFAVAIERNGLLLQQCGFVATSLLGLYRAGFFSRKAIE